MSTLASAAQYADQGSARSETIDLAEGGELIETASFASETGGGKELINPSTMDNDKCPVFKKGRTWHWQLFRRGVCEGKMQQHHKKHTLVR